MVSGFDILLVARSLSLFIPCNHLPYELNLSNHALILCICFILLSPDLYFNFLFNLATYFLILLIYYNIPPCEL